VLLRLQTALRMQLLVGYLPTALTLGLFLIGVPFTAEAQDYPIKPVTVIVPFPAGGPSDVVARIVTEQMSKRLAHAM
jgi:tripartite-type tricarboxylate transporter receptor subunit TctC